MAIKEPITREQLIDILIDTLTDMDNHSFTIVINVLLYATVVNEEDDTFTISWCNINRSE